MKRKTEQARQFIENLHHHIATNTKLRRDVRNHSERDIQQCIYHLTIKYLEKHFKAAGIEEVKAEKKAEEVLYWEGQEGSLRKERPIVFGARNYPDLLIKEPYLVAIEYAQSDTGSVIKRGMGQSIMHTLCGEYDFVYYLFHDKSDDKRIRGSISGLTEREIMSKAWEDFNVYMGFVVEAASDKT